jgi:hypothetical protein
MDVHPDNLLSSVGRPRKLVYPDVIHEEEDTGEEDTEEVEIESPVKKKHKPDREKEGGKKPNLRGSRQRGRGENELTDFERLFVSEYCKDMNATRAYMRLRPDTVKSSARQLGHQVKNKSAVLAAINARVGEKSEWVDDARRKVIETLLNCLGTNLLDFMKVVEVRDKKGNPRNKLVLRDLSRLPKEKLHGLSEINIKEFNGGSSVRVKPIAKTAIIKLLVDVLGMRNEIDPNEKDRTEMDYAARTVARRMSNIMLGIEKMAEIQTGNATEEPA